MDDQIALKLVNALNEINTTLGRIHSAITASRPTGGGGGGGAPIPGSTVTIPFGKNKGKRFSEIGDKSLQWYAYEWEPKPRDDGTLWRNDVVTKRAAQAEAERRGLEVPPDAKTPPAADNQPRGAGAPAAQAPVAQAKPLFADGEDEDVPF